MEESPGEEGPVGAVPETAEQEDDEGVAYDFGLADAAAAEGDIDVVAEPGGEGDVPAAPELGDVAAEVGHVEVAPQADTEEFGAADGDVAIAGEVAVDLEGKEDGGKDERGAAELRGVGENLIDIDGTAVGDE